jgi:LPPG:FO 2-phospho-L-lactate transferase
MQRYGEETWFRLGDQDLATHLLRTEWLRRGDRLTDISARLAAKLSIPHPILPMTDEPVATIVDTVEYGEIAFQTYFVRHRWQPTVTALRLDGIESARMTEAVRTALTEADAILIGPSNPWLSIEPILAVPGLRDLVGSRPVPRIAVSPIVGGQAIKGPAAKIMGEFGYEVSARAVAEYYGAVINGFVYDQIEPVLSLPVPHTLRTETIMKSDDDKIIFARTVLEWMKDWSPIKAG